MSALGLGRDSSTRRSAAGGGPGALRGWPAMHAWHVAALVWAAAVPVVILAAPTSIPPLLNPTAGGQVPTSLLIPLLGAGGLAFAVHHDAPLLLTQTTRPVLPYQLAWITVSLVPAVAIAALGAVQSGQITVGAAERNVLLVSAITLASATVLPAGLATIPALLYDMICLYAAATYTVRGLPTPWWAVALERRTSAPQLLAVLALMGLAAILHSHRQAHQTPTSSG